MTSLPAACAHGRRGRGGPDAAARARAAQVNYVGKAANLYTDAGYELSGAAYVINKHLGATWLWDRVRVSGGAYGGFCDFDPHSGMFSFLSYRDPNLAKTARGPARPTAANNQALSGPPFHSSLFQSSVVATEQGQFERLVMLRLSLL